MGQIAPYKFQIRFVCLEGIQMSRKYTVYFQETVTYAVEIEVENDSEKEAIVELARKKLEDNGREDYSIDTSGLNLDGLEEEE